MTQHRQLAAILFTDIIGYTDMMQRNEVEAVAVIKRYIAVLRPAVTNYAGEILNDYGDGSLCIFSSATNAVQCAMEIQQQLQAEPMVPLRIGLHIGEIFFEDGKVLGDGVNVASRIQSLGQGNTILFSAEIYDKIKNNPQFKSISLGSFEFKNVKKPVELFALSNEGFVIPKRKRMEGKLKEKKLAKRNIFLGAACIILIAGFIIFRLFFNSSDFIADEKSIAVLPFVDMSSGKDQEYFGDGMAEEIISSLTTIQDLKVIGRTSSFQFKGEKVDLRDVGEKLHAGIILEGSVQKYNDRIRITAQLIRVKDNIHLWSEKYDRKLTDIFKIQDDISTNITEKLKLSLTILQKQRLTKKETDPEVYNLYLKALYAYRESKFEQSIQYNIQAIKIDSTYAPAYAYIALSKAWIINHNHDLKKLLLPEAENYAQNAIRLDPQLAEGYSAIALMAWSVEHDFLKAREYFEKSISLNPTASLIKNRYAYFLTWMGDFEKAFKMAQQALQSDPVDPNSYIVLSHVFIYSRKFEDADKYIQEGRRLFPGQLIFQSLLFHKEFYAGQYASFIKQCESLQVKGEKLGNEQMTFLCIAYLKSGYKKKSDDIFLHLKNLSIETNSNGNYFAAMVFAARNEKDSCFARLEKSLDKLEFEFIHFKIDPVFQPLSSDPRYKELYTQYGFDRY